MKGENNTASFPAPVLREQIAEFKRRLVQIDCPPNLQERVTYVLHSEGKYIRPILLLSFCHLIDYKEMNSIDAALAIEYVHAASLIHDDIIDEASLRRGQICMHKKWAVKEALLVGDFLYARAFELIGSLGCEQATAVLAAAVTSLSLSELRELTSAKSDFVLPPKEDYYATIYNKTAVLFGACCEIAVLLGKKERYRKQARIFGDKFGMAFQLRDDMLDYVADDNEGSEILQDLAQGKITLPFIYAYEIADSAQKRDIRNSLQQMTASQEANKVSADTQRLLAQLIAKREVKEYIQQQMQGYLINAEKQLDSFASGEVRSSLFSLTRMLAQGVATP